MSKTIDTIVFDIDGTLIDSVGVVFGSYQHISDVLGYDRYSWDQIVPYMGRRLEDAFSDLYPNTELHRVIEVNAQYHDENAGDIKAFEFAGALLAALRARGYKLAALTGNNHKADGLLTEHGLRHYFSSLVHSGRVTNGKPHPEGFYLCVEECGSEPHRAIMVGDTINDILTGKNAQAALTIGVSHGFGSVQSLEESGADVVVSGLGEVLDVIERAESGARTEVANG